MQQHDDQSVGRPSSVPTNGASGREAIALLEQYRVLMSESNKDLRESIRTDLRDIRDGIERRDNQLDEKLGALWTALNTKVAAIEAKVASIETKAVSDSAQRRIDLQSMERSVSGQIKEVDGRITKIEMRISFLGLIAGSIGAILIPVIKHFLIGSGR